MRSALMTRTVLGYSLGLLYLMFAVIHWRLQDSALTDHGLAMFYLCLLLTVAALAVVFLQEWGRKLLVVGNTVMCFYLLLLYVTFPDVRQVPHFDMYQLGLVYINIIVVLYYGQRSVKVEFRPDLAYAARKSILIIDDDEACLKAAKGILIPNGYSALSASSGEKGLQVAKLQKPDLILLDIILPGLKGREVCVKLKEDPETRDIPVVFLTSKNSPDDIAAEKAAGGIAHLTKPVRAKTLLDEVKKHLN